MECESESGSDEGDTSENVGGGCCGVGEEGSISCQRRHEGRGGISAGCARRWNVVGLHEWRHESISRWMRNGVGGKGIMRPMGSMKEEGWEVVKCEGDRARERLEEGRAGERRAELN